MHSDEGKSCQSREALRRKHVFWFLVLHHLDGE